MADSNGAANGQDPVYLVDGSGYIFRAFYALPPMTRPDGTPVNAVYGFTNMLSKLVEDSEASHLAVMFDTARKTFRSDIYPEYKAHRPPPPDELVPQFELIREATRAFNIACIEMPGFEADDLIATFARRAAAEGRDVVIVSSDKDLMQMVDDHIRMMDPVKNRMIGRDEVIERFGVGPDKVVDVQALAGDSTDNVPGVPGIGVKTAAQLINDYGDLDTLLDRAEEIKQPKRRENLINNAELARISRKLVRLDDNVPTDHSVDDFEVKGPEPEVLLRFLEEQGFKSLIARERARYGMGAGDGAVAIADPATPPDEVAYAAIQSEDELKTWIDDAVRAGIVAVDTETTSLDSMRAELVGVSMSTVGGKACYVPLGHVAPRAQGSPTATRRPERRPSKSPWTPPSPRSSPCSRIPGSSRSGTTSNTTCRCWRAMASMWRRSTTP
jgi:DNA polymerase-1